MTATATPALREWVANCPKNPAHLRRRRTDAKGGWFCPPCFNDWRYKRLDRVPGRTRRESGQVHAWDKWGNGNTCRDCGVERRVTIPEYGKAQMEFFHREKWATIEPRCRFDA